MRYPHTLCRGLLLSFAAALALCAPTLAHGGGSMPGTRVITSPALGVSLILPAGWQRVSAAKVAPGVLAFSLPPHAGGAGSSWRLLIEGLARTRLQDPGQAARAAACALTARLHVPIRQSSVRYAGVPGIRLTGMPGAGQTTQIILAHQGALYDLVVFGSSLHADQRQALRSLRFVARTGAFPAVQPHLRLCP